MQLVRIPEGAVRRSGVRYGKRCISPFFMRTILRIDMDRMQSQRSTVMAINNVG